MTEPSSSTAAQTDAPHQHPSDDDDDEDQIIASYDVYLTPSLPSNFPAPAHASTANTSSTTATDTPASQQTYHPTALLQFPTRDRAHPYNAANGCAPQPFRLKPHAGFLELDVPLNARHQYHTPKARKWASALGHANSSQNRIRQSGGEGGEKSAGFGVANGFAASGPMGSRGPPKKTVRVGSAEDVEMEVEGDEKSESDADEEEDVLHTLTLGGKLKKRGNKEPYVFVGAFKDDKELHLTEVAGVAQMRAQFHHLDAEAQMSRYPGSGRGGGGHALDRDGKPRIFTMPGRGGGTAGSGLWRGGVDRSGPGGEHSAVKELLQWAAEEPWSTLGWTDEEDEASYEEFARRMFLSAEKMEEVRSRWSEEEYLERVGGGILERRKVWERSRRRGRKRGAKTVRFEGVDGPRDKGKGKAVAAGEKETVEIEDGVASETASSELSDVDEDISEPEGMAS